MQAGTVGYPSWKKFRPADPEWAVIDFLQRHAEWRAAKTRERREQGLEETSCPGRADDSERRPSSTFIFRENHCVEEKRDEIGKMVRVKMGDQNVRDPMSVHAGLNEIHQCSRAEIQQKRLIGLHQIAGCSAGGMDIGSGAENRQTHSSHIEYNSC
jgi:hypothetical protein